MMRKARLFALASVLFAVLATVTPAPYSGTAAEAATKLCNAGNLPDEIVKTMKAVNASADEIAGALHGASETMKIIGYTKQSVLGRTVFKRKTGIELGKPASVDYKLVQGKKVVALLQGGATNLQLMLLGHAPIGPDGAFVNLHHLIGKEPGPLVEIFARDHRKYSKELHAIIEDSFRNYPSLQYAFDKYRESYWKLRAKELAP
jgi:hypothetical protein